ncbi:zinc finger protein 665 isoform X1 [Esox lucius]|uniref:zinc finger protein 665 isoform X1 n=2 Tax=Esox lucius TaxID=8010 RepID=UPI0014769C8F|nr:zinc finger protein 665 isoform X1 [Esox lucius]XP_010886960.2 zinc finger protein 665 isoform X1 [Esox lucius]XP_010886961.2 zinc finger protein 665 isoform X1 [Esox lucius]XP_010886962.2 zinc finger protein 665 isoform X1 [Esox lucius]
MSEELIIVEWAETTTNPSAVFPDSTVENMANTVVEEDYPSHNMIIHCEECDASNKDQSDNQGSLAFMLDSPTPMGIPQRALLTLPHGLVVGRSSITGAGLGVLNLGPTLLPGMHFGPYEGEVTTRDRALKSDYSWEVWNSKGESEYIDAARDTHSNWLRYVNCARNKKEANLVALQYRGVVFFHCCRSVLPGEELLFWPGAEYIDRFKDPSDQIWLRNCTPSELRTGLSSQVFLCRQCQLSFTTESYLQRHTKQSHPVDLFLCEPDNHHCSATKKPDPEAALESGLAYKCPQCPKSFKQKGHVQRHLQTVHSKVKPYCCIHCRRCFAQLSCLARHQIRVHRKKHAEDQELNPPASDSPRITTSVLFPCPHCPFSSSMKSSLSQHMRRHSQRRTKVIQIQASVEVRGEINANPELPEPSLVALPTETETDEPPEPSLGAPPTQTNELAQTGEEAYSCSQCGKMFKHKGHVQRHMRAVHSNVRPYCCLQCRKCFAQGYDLARHQTRVHGKKKKQEKASVQLGGESPASSNDLPSGTQAGRSPSQRLKNLRVKSSRMSMAKMKANSLKQRHASNKEKIHSSSTDTADVEEEDVEAEARYSCTECLRSYSNAESLKAHQCVPAGVATPYTCSTCGATFKRHTTLKKHTLNKHPKQHQSHCCTHCGRFFSQAGGLQRHLEAEVCKDVQLSSEAYPCSYCQFSFTEERYLQKHIKRHHPNEYVCLMGSSQALSGSVGAGEVHLCFQCGKSYKYAQSFKAHRCFRSVEAKLNLCDECGKGFSCLYSLKQHQRIHTGEKPYRCTFCQKGFTHSGQLNVHVRVHTGERPFLCTECGESFRQSGDLKRHERKHTGVKPCTCPECGKSFSRPQSLKAHLLLHNGERRFKCEQCGKRFSRSYHLTRHHEKMHS